MSNGQLLSELRLLSAMDPVTIEPIVRDRLMLAAIADIYEITIHMSKDIKFMKPWVAGIRWFVILTSTVTIGIVINALIHTVVWPF